MFWKLLTTRLWCYAQFLMSKEFKRKIEDFECENCNEFVKGNGYTNHCTECLWSKHVDVFPGDRAQECGGKMKPVAISQKADSYIIIHKCVNCTHKKKNKLTENDNMDTVVELAKNMDI